MGIVIWMLILAVIIAVVLFMRNSFREIEKKQQEESSNLIILTDDTFEKTIAGGVTLIDFWAPWCTPCNVQNPVINQIADELAGKVKICKINVDENKITANKMKIRNIPNILIFKNGKAEMQLIGVKPKHIIMKAIHTLLH